MISALDILREDERFLTASTMKPKREEWVLQAWLKRHDPAVVWTRPDQDPPDFIVAGQGVEVIEVLDEGRKRGDECRAAIRREEGALDGECAGGWSDLHHIASCAHLWISSAIASKSAKYEPRMASSWKLLVYVNVGWPERINWPEVRRITSANPPVFDSVVCLLNSDEIVTLK